MTLDQFLDHKYQVTARLPALGASHQRYVVQGTSGTPEQFVLSFCDYAKPVGRTSLERQRRVVEAMTRPPVALLCRALDSRLESDYQWMVSEFPGEFSLKELLQQRQSLTMEEVEAFLRLLTEACEAATTLGWPRLPLDAANLFIDPRLGLPRIPAPDIPSFEASGVDGPAFDPMATMQFNVADFRAATTDPIPKDTHDYVLPLAALCCDLLGQPQSMRGGNARYQPVPQLTSQQNVLLRRALTSEGRAGFASAKSFMDEFFGISMSPSIAAHTERLRTMTVTISRTQQQNDPQPINPLAVTIRVAQPPPLPSAPAKEPEPPPIVRQPVSVKPAEKEAAMVMRPTLRLRLVPDHEDAPIFALVADEALTLGRSAADADFVAQFRPRSNVNDGRSRSISRTQTRIRKVEDKVRLQESSAVNPSVANDAPVVRVLDTPAPLNFLLAGEYPVEVRMMPGDYPEKREVVDWDVEQSTPLDGALIVRAGGSGVLLCEAAMVFSDVGLHFSKSGRPWFRAEAGAVPAARIHRLAGQFWLEPIAASVFSRAGNMDTPTLPHELLLLRDGDKLRFGPYGYKVLGYNLSANDTPLTQG